MRPRRSLFDLAIARTDDGAVIDLLRNAWSRGLLGGGFHRDIFRLDEPVGRARPNRRAEVARVESLLDRSGDLDLVRTEGPTGYFSTLQDEAITRFQRRNGLAADGVINPDGETIGALLTADPAEPRQQAEREQRCVQNDVHLGNVQNQIARAVSEIERANARVVALSEEAAALNARHGLQWGSRGSRPSSRP